MLLTILYAQANLLLAVAFKCCGPPCNLLWRLVGQARSFHSNELTVLHQRSLLSCCIRINHHLYCFYWLHNFQNVQLLLTWTREITQMREVDVCMCKSEFGHEQQWYMFWSSMCHISTWFGYNLQAELHCAICLYSLIEEAVIRVKLKKNPQQI